MIFWALDDFKSSQARDVEEGNWTMAPVDEARMPPAATARRFGHTPEAMAAISAGIGVVSACGGLWLSLAADTPTGPSIVVVAAGLFAVANLWSLVRPA